MIEKKNRPGARAVVTLLVLVATLMAIALAAPVALARTAPLAIEGPVAAEFDLQPAAALAPVQTLAIDVQQLRAEDEERDAAGLPPRFALPENAWLTPENSGTWERLDDEYMIWRTRVTAPGAVSLNFGFTGYRLPKGARLSLYPADTQGLDDKRGLAIFTAADNEDHGELWTPVILADDVVIELVLPASERNNYRLELSSINKGYRYFGEMMADEGLFDKQGSCNVDVVCPEGDPWQYEIHSVGAYSTGGSIFCTGVMMNNTAEDGTPFFLTANHCGITNASAAASLVVYWNFESANCGDLAGGLLNDFQTGAVHLASSSTSDVTLVQLDDPVNPAHEVSFAGWNNASMDFPGVTAIHHPNGDEKAISFEYDATTTTTYLSNTVPGNGTHIRVTDWDVGTTEPGSSGSPLFDPDHRVVGQLHGGYAACGNDLSDWYGRLSVSWAVIGTYLDPLGTGQATIDTYSPWASGLQVVGSGLASEGNSGGPFTPASAVFTLTNNDPTDIDFAAATTVAWADVAPASGTIPGGGSVVVTVSLNAAADALVNGLYAGAVDFTNTTSGDGDTSRPLQLTVGLPEFVYGWNLDVDPVWDMNGQWAWGIPTGVAGDHGLPDPTSGATGSYVLGYNLTGPYADNLPATHLTTTAIDCSEISATSLRFQRWLNVEQPAYDHASVSVSNDGVNFQQIWTNGSEITDSAWMPQEFDISAVADGEATVYVRWTMGTTDSSWYYGGWNIDDIEIWGLPNPVSAANDLPASRLGVDSYPNPFNPMTRIRFNLAQAGHATIQVFDLQGRHVRTLVDGAQPAGPGEVVWDGTDGEGRKVSSGVYFARVASGGQAADHKMVLLK
ncbi:trypsin-like peptidase domain-containing protein [bacterium]|nr:trypsin-like peptidase domain-containing protein [bacterium]